MTYWCLFWHLKLKGWLAFPLTRKVIMKPQECREEDLHFKTSKDAGSHASVIPEKANHINTAYGRNLAAKVNEIELILWSNS